MLRKIIHIDEEKCNGCGACANACHEGAIGMVNGKARLLRENYCDGLGDCLPACPTGAITFEVREAPAYDSEAVAASKKKFPTACPGLKARGMAARDESSVSQLRQWPVQIKLLPVRAAFFEGCDLLIAATCTAFACGDFHQKMMKGKVTAVGCPKLDMVDYSEKLTEIIKTNDIRSITVARMEVPCCGGLEYAVNKAVKNSGKAIPVQVVTFGTDGETVL